MKAAFGVQTAASTGSARCFARPIKADERQVITEEREEQRRYVRGRFSTLSRRNTQRNSHQRKHEARERKREPAVQFNTRLHPIGSRAGVVAQLAGIHFGEYLPHDRFGRRRFEYLLPARKRTVNLRVVLIHLMRAGVSQRELDLISLRIGNRNGFGRDSDARPLCFLAQADAALFRRRQVGEKHVAPDYDRPRLHVTHVKNRVWKLLFKDARLNLGSQLLRLEFAQNSDTLTDGARCQPQGCDASEQRRQQGKRKHRRNHGTARHARRAHGRNLAIRGHPPQADQNPHQDAKRHRQRQYRGQRQREQPQHRLRVRRRANQQLKIPVHALQEDDESREHRAQQGARENLAKNVPAEQTH